MHVRKGVTKVVSSLLVIVFVLSMTMGNVTTVKAASFTDLNQSQIVTAMGAGWNLGNQLEAAIGGVPNETYWGNPTITEDLIKAVKNEGFSTIRIPVSYLSKIGTGPSYTIDSAWLDRVQQVVDLCIKNGLYVIINIHGDGYNSIDGGWLLCNGSDQATIRAKYKACWTQIATRFQDYDEHLIFESMNEVHDGTYGMPNATYYSNINALNQIFVDTVRQTGGNNNRRWLLLPGWNTNIDYTVGNYGFVMPTDYYRSSAIPSSEKRLMISVHYYDPWDFCGDESPTITQWGSAATDSSKVASYGNESYLKAQFYSLYTNFTSQGYPVVIGEYGTIDKSAYDSANLASRVEWTKKVNEYAKQYGCVPVLWDNGYNGVYGFGVFDRTTKKVTQPAIIDAIMSVYKNGSNSDSSGTKNTVIYSGGSANESYATSDPSWLVNAAEEDIISIEYTCTNANNAYWGVLNWGVSVNGTWVNGPSYAAASTATDTVTATVTVGELKSSLGITNGSSVAYLSLSAYNSGKIMKISIAATNTKGTDFSFSANDLTVGTYTSSFTSGNVTIGASSSKNVEVRTRAITVGDVNWLFLSYQNSIILR